MKSIMLNQSYSNNINKDYRNRLNDKTIFTLGSSNTYYNSYNSSNLLNYHNYKECRVVSSDNHYSLKIDIDTTDQNQLINTLALQFNKENELFTNLFDNTIQIYIKLKSDDSEYARFDFNKNNTQDGYSSSLKTYSTGRIVDNMIIITKDILEMLNISSIDLSLYYIEIYTYNENIPYLPIANVCLNNEYVIEVDSTFTFQQKNLSKNTVSKTTGINFIDRRSTQKTIKANLKLLTSSEENEFNEAMVKYNTADPIWFFPYITEVYDGIPTEWDYYDYAIRNLRIGGYYILEYSNYKTKTYDVIDVKIDMKEYK